MNTEQGARTYFDLLWSGHRPNTEHWTREMIERLESMLEIIASTAS